MNTSMTWIFLLWFLQLTRSDELCSSLISRGNCDCFLQRNERTERCRGNIESLVNEAVLKNITNLHVRDGNSLQAIIELVGLFPVLKTLDVENNGHATELSANSFDKFPNLKYLRLHNCSLYYIEKGAFKHLPHLMSLTLSGNSKLTFDKISEGIANMNSTLLEVFNISGVHNEENMEFGVIKANLFLNLNQTALKVIDVSWTRLLLIQAPFHLISTIETFNFSGTNMIGTTDCLSYFSVLPNMRTVVGDFWLYIPRGNEHRPELPSPRFLRSVEGQNECIHHNFTTEEGCVILSPNLKYLQLRKIDLDSLFTQVDGNVLCFAKNNLETLIISHFYASSTLGKLLGLHNLKIFDLSYPDSSHSYQLFQPSLFTDMPSLEHIYLVQTRLERFSSTELENLLTRNKYLKSVDMSDNGLQTLPYNTFEQNELLEYIDLSGNKLSKFVVNLSKNTRLININLRNNKLKEVDPVLLIPNTYHIDATDNDILCKCDYLTVFDSDIRIKISCKYKGKNYLIENKVHFPPELSELCSQGSDIVVVISIGLSIYIIVLIILAVFICCFKKMSQRINKPFRSPFNRCETKRHIAFIAYSHNDTNLVVHSIYTPLVEKLSETLKENKELIESQFVLYDKDFLPGENIDDVCEHAVKQSDITIIIVSEHSLKSSWCRTEVQHAERNGCEIIPIFLTGYQPERLTGEFKILSKKVRLYWPQDSNEAEIEEIINILCRSLIEYWIKKRAAKKSVHETVIID